MPTDAELRELLLDSRVPWGVAFRMGGARPVAVKDLLALSHDRFGDEPSLEAQIDAYIERLGGSREEMVDPWSAPRRAARKLLGKENPSQDIWALPPSFFDDEPR
jgi:hypothetical protein